MFILRGEYNLFMERYLEPKYPAMEVSSTFFICLEQENLSQNFWRREHSGSFGLLYP
jgi:hypothetical protein